jgi:hypothetical protein
MVITIFHAFFTLSLRLLSRFSVIPALLLLPKDIRQKFSEAHAPSLLFAVGGFAILLAQRSQTRSEPNRLEIGRAARFGIRVMPWFLGGPVYFFARFWIFLAQSINASSRVANIKATNCAVLWSGAA